MAGNLQPLDQKFPVVKPDGTPTDYFIRWAQQRQVDIGTAITEQDLLDYLVAHELQAGSGIGLTPGGNLSDSPTIAAKVQEILDQISTTEGSILYRSATGWAALAPGTSGNFLKTNGASADPGWAPIDKGGVPIVPIGGTAFDGGTFDTGGYATNANFYVPLVKTSFSQVVATFSNVTIGNIYTVFLATVNTSFNITGTVATATNPFTTTAAGLQEVTFNLPATMLPGIGYIVGLVVTNGSGTTPCHALFQNTLLSYSSCPFDLKAVFAYASSAGSPRRINYAQTSSSPSSGAPVNNTTSSASALILLP